LNTSRPFLLLLSFILWVGLACSLPQPTASPAQPDAPQAPADQPGAAAPAEPPSGAPEPSALTEPAATATPEPPPTHPLGLRQGLAGLNSYRMSLHILFIGPSEQDRNESTTLTEYNKEGDQFHSRVDTSSSSADEPETATEFTEQYRLGVKSCQISSSGDEAAPDIEVTAEPPAMQAMTQGLTNLFDVVVFAENPQLVGQEDVNGIPANHFTFTVSGLAVATGAEVTISEGEYWVALEGQYLVKYRAILETRSAPAGDPSAEVMHLEVEMELIEVDTPISITLPAECQ
jgi:hypothetical protein